MEPDQKRHKVSVVSSWFFPSYLPNHCLPKAVQSARKWNIPKEDQHAWHATILEQQNESSFCDASHMPFVPRIVSCLYLSSSSECLPLLISFTRKCVCLCLSISFLNLFGCLSPSKVCLSHPMILFLVSSLYLLCIFVSFCFLFLRVVCALS